MSRTLKQILEDKSHLLEKMTGLHARTKDRTLTGKEEAEYTAVTNDLLAVSREEAAYRTLLADRATRAGVTPPAAEAGTPFADVARAAAGTGERRDGITSTSGAATIETDNVRDELIHTLQARNPLADLGARFVPMANHSVFPTVGGVGYSHYDEGDTLTVASGPVIGARTVQFKTMAVLILVSKMWLHDSSDRGRMLLNQVVTDAINDAIVNSALHGSAANKEPNGLDNIAGVLTVDAAGSAVTDYNLHLDAVAALAGRNVDVNRVGYIQGTKTWRQTAGLVGTDGQPLGQPKALEMVKAAHTTAVLENYGAGNDQTRLYFGDYSNLVIGLGGEFRMELAEKYADTLQTGFLAYLRYDIQALRPDNFCIVENLAS